MNTKPHIDESCFYDKASVIAPLIGLGSLILIVSFFVLTAHDSEGQLWGQVIGFVLGGLILIISTLFGFGFTFVSKKSKKSRSLFWAGLTLNTILLSLILYILIPLALRFIR